MGKTSSNILNIIQSGDEIFKSMFDEKEINEILEKVTALEREISEEQERLESANFLHEMNHIISFDTLNKVHETIDAISYSDDYEKYNEEVKDFMDYIAMLQVTEDFAVIKVNRSGNKITYSRYQQGMPVYSNKISMVSSLDLKTLYETLKVAYGEQFVPGCKHEMMNGWSLLPTIADKIILEIDSDNQLDRNWIYQEAHNKPVTVDEPRKK